MTSNRGKIKVLTIKDKKKVPVIVGELILRKTKAGSRPHKFRISNSDKKNEHLAPESFIEMLKKSDRILISTDCDGDTSSRINEMLTGFQLTSEPVNVCRLCLLQDKFNFVGKKSYRFHDEYICWDCAKDELYRYFRNSGFSWGEQTISYLEDLLCKSKDLDRTIGFLNPTELDKEFTHYDTITSESRISELRFNHLPLDKSLRNLLSKKADKLLPVQTLAVEQGLFDGINLLVTSVTATGKTLVGEMVGVNNILKKRGKMLFLVPLVALANQKYYDFSTKYSKIGLKTSIRVGSNRIKSSKNLKMKTNLDSDIVVATYEGIDYILRSGNSDSLGNIGTVVIDEVHTIEDKERGHRLDGLIARLKYITSNTQFIYLSATVANPDHLAKKLNASIVNYEHRPVPIERHLIYCEDHRKNKLMAKLVQEEYKQKSSKGHFGQTIIFTNSRKNCQHISKSLPISSSAYHAGMLQHERNRIEQRFKTGKLPVVVTTAALAAGVDFPASQVIFESLAMGIEWLSIQEFMQMLGRAGRPDYHDRGRIVILATPDKKYTANQEGTEDEIAISLLKGKLESLAVDYSEDDMMEEILASAAVTNSKRDLQSIHNSMVASYQINIYLKTLAKTGFLAQRGNSINLSKLGKIAAKHFLTTSKAILIKEGVVSNTEPMDIITSLELFDSAYFKSAAQISKSLNINLSSRVFQGSSLDILFDGETLSKLNPTLQDRLLNFATEFLTCGCKGSPFCGCPERKFSFKLLGLRGEGLSPEAIIDILEDTYGVTAYTGDILDYLEKAVRNLDAVLMMAQAYSKSDVYQKSITLRKKLEG